MITCLEDQPVSEDRRISGAMVKILQLIAQYVSRNYDFRVRDPLFCVFLANISVISLDMTRSPSLPNIDVCTIPCDVANKQTTLPGKLRVINFLMFSLPAETDPRTELGPFSISQFLKKYNNC